jgi:hypothetical protein
MVDAPAVLSVSADEKPSCPRCEAHTKRLGFYHYRSGEKIQRFYCTTCKHTFVRESDRAAVTKYNPGKNSRPRNTALIHAPESEPEPKPEAQPEIILPMSSKASWRDFDSIPCARGEAVSMLQLVASGEYTLASLRADILGDNDFRREVLRPFDALVLEGRVDEVVRQARERTANLAEITNARHRAAAARRRTRIKRHAKASIIQRRKRFSEQQCARIQRLHAEGFSREAIGERFNVSHATIARVLSVSAQ